MNHPRFVVSVDRLEAGARFYDSDTSRNGDILPVDDNLKVGVKVYGCTLASSAGKWKTRDVGAPIQGDQVRQANPCGYYHDEKSATQGERLLSAPRSPTTHGRSKPCVRIGCNISVYDI